MSHSRKMGTFPRIYSLLVLALSCLCLAVADSAPSCVAPVTRGAIVFTVSSPSLYVPVPVEWSQGISGITVTDERETALRAVPICVDGCCVAVAVSDAVADGRLATLRLEGASEVSHVEGATIANPVAVDYCVKDVTTRGHTSGEMLRFMANLHLIPYPQALKSPMAPTYARFFVPNFSQAEAHKEILAGPKKKGQPFLHGISHWHAMFALDKETTVVFKSREWQTAWTLLIDGAPVANWQEMTAVAAGAGNSAPVTLSPGVHSVQLLVIQHGDEPFPKVAMESVDAPGSQKDVNLLSAVYPAVVPDKYGIQLGEETKWLNWQCKESFAFPETGELLTVLPDGGLGTDGVEAVVQVGAQKLTIRRPILWQRSRAAIVEMRLETPVAFAKETPFTITVFSRIPGYIPESLRKAAKIDVTLYDGDNVLQKKEYDRTDDSQTLNLSISDVRATCISIGIAIAGKRIVREQRIRLVKAAETGAISLSAMGTSIFANDERSMLVNTDVIRQGVFKLWGDVVFLDSVIGVTCAPGATALFGEGKSHCRHWCVPLLAGVARSLVLLSVLKDVIDASPRAVVIPVDCRWCDDAQWQDVLAFVTAALSSSGSRVVLVALPDYGDTYGNARITVRAVKTFGMHAGIRVIDAYSLALKEGVKAEDWCTDGGCINDDGRRWLYNLCK